MKATELIEKLQGLIDTYGDCNISYKKETIYTWNDSDGELEESSTEDFITVNNINVYNDYNRTFIIEE